MLDKLKSNSLYIFIVRIMAILFLSTIVWSIVIFYYYEYTISKEIKKFMMEEKEDFLARIKTVDFIKKGDNYAILISELTNDFKKDNIDFIGLYNFDGSTLFEIENKKNSKIINSIIDEEDKYNLHNEHKLIIINDYNAYLYIKAKIDSQNYYLNMLIKLDDNKLEVIKNDVYFTLFVVFITIFIVVISILPIVYSQYKKLLSMKNKLISSNIDTLKLLGNVIAKRDSDTIEHNYRVTYYSVKVAESMNKNRFFIEELIKGAFLHDIGKIAISDNILLKPAKLNFNEFELMKTHVLHGIDMVKNVPWLQNSMKVILNHHEKVDGSGYPNRKYGDDIPLEARIFAICDVFDALTSKRPYKESFSIDESIKIIKNDIGIHFDSEIVIYFEDICKVMYEEIDGKNIKELEVVFNNTLKPYFFQE